MTVTELVELLQDRDPNAEVLIMCQKRYPFEYQIAGLTVREEFEHAEDDCDDDNCDVGHFEPNTSPDDVFLLEGTQLRGGSRAAWKCALD